MPLKLTGCHRPVISCAGLPYGVCPRELADTCTLVVEDGCGTEATYTQGQAFVEPPNRIHRGKNLTDATVVTAQTFLVPAGSPTSVSHATAACGVPQTVDECKNDGWRAFNYPDTFISQGECIEFVLANP